MTLSNGNLTATTTGSGGVRSSGYMATSGKYYWENTATTATSAWGGGIATVAANLAVVISGGLLAAIVNGAGTVTINGTQQGATGLLGTINPGAIVCFAFDVGAQLIWFRNTVSGNWNGSGTANPATGAGGFSTSALGAISTPLYALAGATGSGNATTGNFGPSFSGAVPSNFTSGIPGVQICQRLQVAFTPQQAGRLRALVKLHRVGGTVWINPQVTVT